MMVAQSNVSVSPGSPPNTALPITTSAGILNLDHYKYLRSLLPPVPHFIESLSFTDLNNWECQIYVNLVTESDCMKWLADFEDKTSTDWRVDQDASRNLAKARGCSWQLVYRCVAPDSRKDCTAQLEMRIFAQQEGRGKQGGKHYPCEVTISFCHCHHTSHTSLLTTEGYKAQDIPSHLKEGFEGYFQETMSPVQPGVTSSSLSSSSPRTTSSLAPSSSSSPQPVQLQLKVDSGSRGREEGATTSLSEVSQGLERTQVLLRAMLQQGGSGAGAVRQFVEKFERVRGDRGQLEDALTSFGGQWDWLVSPPDTTVLTHPSGEAATQVILQPQSPLASPQSRGVKKIKREEEVLMNEPVTQMYLEGSQVVVQPSSATPEPDLKRRKRARCGTCSGCMNRDKTQDCRQCRNCLDQKRYGGPGRLKKACIKRQCAVISQMIAAEISPDQKPVLHSVPVHTSLPLQSTVHPSLPLQSLQSTVHPTAHSPRSVKTEPQETAVTLAARSEPSQQGLAAQTVSLVGSGGQTVSLQGTGGQTVSLISSASPGQGGQQTFSIGGQTYSLVGSPGTGQTVSIGGQTVSLAAPVSSSSGVQTTTSSPSSLPGSTLLSWPGSQYAPTFQVQQQQQPVQFVFQPAQSFSSPTGQAVQVQYTTQLGTQQLESLVTEASRHHGVS